MLVNRSCRNPWIRNGLVVESFVKFVANKEEKEYVSAGTQPAKLVCCTEAVWFRAGDEHEESRSFTIERKCSVELR
jgi:hypothetical protein